MPKFTAKELKNKSPEDLAVLAEPHHPLSAEAILIEREWQRRLINEQQKFNKKIMLEQHELNKTIAKSHKRTVVILAIITALSGIFGGLIQKYGPDLPLLHKSHIQIQKQSHKDTSLKETKPPKEFHEIETTKKSVSSKIPPR